MAATSVDKKKLSSKQRGRLNEAALPIARLWELLIPDFEIGELKRRISTSNRVKVGQIAGCLGSNGYRYVQINGKIYTAHRIIWAMKYGEWPSDELDHINGNRADNRISNLREVSRTENCRNQKKRNTNTSGVVGVYWYKRNQNWMVRIAVNGKFLHKGYFDTFEEAVAVRKAAEIEHGFHVNHGLTAEQRLAGAINEI